MKISENELNELVEKLKKCREVSLEEVDINKVTDLKDLKISRKKSRNERIIEFIKKNENPYIFKSGTTLVKISFSNNSRSASKCVLNVLKSIYK